MTVLTVEPDDCIHFAALCAKFSRPLFGEESPSVAR